MVVRAADLNRRDLLGRASCFDSHKALAFLGEDPALREVAYDRALASWGLLP